jgi:hypothetical protein
MPSVDYYSTDDCSVEYNPCIRKGKHKPKHKKQKKYEAKVQKMNLIRSKNHKIIYADLMVTVPASTLIDELLEILKDTNTELWKDEHEQLYTYYHLNDIEKYKKQYDVLQEAITREYEDAVDDAMEEYYENCKWEMYFDRIYRYWY